MPEGYRRARRSKRMFRRWAALGSCVRQAMGCEKGRPGTGQAVKTSHIALRARGLQAAGREGLSAGARAYGRRRSARARRGLSRDPLGTTADASPRGPLIALGHDFYHLQNAQRRRGHPTPLLSMLRYGVGVADALPSTTPRLLLHQIVYRGIRALLGQKLLGTFRDSRG